jgi:dTDP-4-dehydrorhamnose reductase
VGERAIWDAGGPHLVLRTSWLYAPWANNFVRTIFKASRERDELQVVNDQRGRPTSAEHLARASLALLDKGAHGTLHVTDGGECTWFDFASEIVRLAGHRAAVKPCTSAQFPRPAKRPAYSVLDLGPTEALLGPMPDWHENLADVMRRLEPIA